MLVATAATAGSETGVVETTGAGTGRVAVAGTVCCTAVDGGGLGAGWAIPGPLPPLSLAVEAAVILESPFSRGTIELAPATKGFIDDHVVPPFSINHFVSA